MVFKKKIFELIDVFINNSRGKCSFMMNFSKLFHFCCIGFFQQILKEDCKHVCMFERCFSGTDPLGVVTTH